MGKFCISETLKVLDDSFEIKAPETDVLSKEIKLSLHDQEIPPVIHEDEAIVENHMPPKQLEPDKEEALLKEDNSKLIAEGVKILSDSDMIRIEKRFEARRKLLQDGCRTLGKPIPNSMVN